MWQHLAMQAFGRPDILADISSMELAGAYVAREILALIDQHEPTLLNKIMTIDRNQHSLLATRCRYIRTADAVTTKISLGQNRLMFDE